ncbi:MAG: NYN domain-containing protein [Candidatus Schekmanbacteria bacterium]|nr:NYN domain-containing protein [Candidatus Schekmanbacteria bacterium]
MTAILLIDGYNLIGAFGSLDRDSLENLRNDIIKKLASYKKVKGSNVVVVFDGENSGADSESRDRISGIDLLYSRHGEKADDVIVRMAASGKGKYVIVTSDNDLISRCSSLGCTAITSGEFIDRMELAAALDDEFEDYDDGNIYDTKRITKKKGNGNKLPKKERQRKAKLEKF